MKESDKCVKCGGTEIIVWMAGDGVGYDPCPDCTKEKFIDHDSMLKTMREE